MKAMNKMKSRVVKVDMEEAYASVEKMLFKLSWDTHHTYGIPFDECLSECHFAFVKALNWRFNPNKGTKFSTQVCTIAKWRLRSLARRQRLAVVCLELDEQTAGAAPPQYSACLEVVEGLSEDAKEIIALLLDTPIDILWDSPSTPKRLLTAVKDYLIEEGRCRKCLKLAHQEIEAAFREVWSTS